MFTLVAESHHISQTTRMILGFVVFAMVFTSIMTFTLIPKRADAFIGFFDLSFNIKIGDPVQAAWHVLQKHLLGALNQVLDHAISWAINKFRSTFLIQSFVRYDACITRRLHLGDYLTLYYPGQDNIGIRNSVAYSVDRLNYGGLPLDNQVGPFVDDLASAYRAFEPGELNPTDPDYLRKLSSLSDPLTHDTYWYWSVQDQSFAAKSEASQGAALSLLSDGYKPENAEPDPGSNIPDTPQSTGDDSVQDLIDADTQRMIEEFNNVSPPGFLDNVNGAIKNKITKSSKEITGMMQATYISMFDKAKGEQTAVFLDVSKLVTSFLDRFLTGMFDSIINGRQIYVFDEFSDCLNLNVNPIKSANSAAIRQAITAPSLPGLPDVCTYTTAGQAKTDLGEASAEGGDGATLSETDTVTVQDPNIPLNSRTNTIITETTGGEGGSVEIDLNDGRISAAPADPEDPNSIGNPCAAAGTQQQAEDYYNTFITGEPW